MADGTSKGTEGRIDKTSKWGYWIGGAAASGQPNLETAGGEVLTKIGGFQGRLECYTGGQDVAFCREKQTKEGIRIMYRSGVRAAIGEEDKDGMIGI